MALSDGELSAARNVIRCGLEEDLRYGPDVTTVATVPAGAVATASMVPREAGVIAGVDVALFVLDEVLGACGYPAVGRCCVWLRLEPGQPLLYRQALSAELCAPQCATQ